MANPYSKYYQAGYKAGKIKGEFPNSLYAFSNEADWWWYGYWDGYHDNK